MDERDVPGALAQRPLSLAENTTRTSHADGQRRVNEQPRELPLKAYSNIVPWHPSIFA